MKRMSIEEITALTKKEAEQNISMECNNHYESNLVPIYIVVRTDQEGRISSHTYPSCLPMGVQLEEAMLNKAGK